MSWVSKDSGIWLVLGNTQVCEKGTIATPGTRLENVSLNARRLRT